ncbi:MAG: TIGR03067 domain-containing protein [Thermoanaerobaculia bacterium]
MRIVLALSIALLVANSAIAAAKPVPIELQELQGRWTPVSPGGDGKAEASDGPGDIIISDDSWIQTSPEGDSITTLRIDATKKPKQIDQIAGPTILRGIYELNNDTLTIALTVPLGGKVSSKRPTAFATKPGDPFAVFVYKRAGDAEGLQPLAWQPDWKTAFATAKNQHQLVFVDYYATWCKPCLEMDATVFRLPDVKKQLGDFVLLRVDFDKGSEAASHHVSAIPAYVVYDPGARERFRIVGTTPAPIFRSAIDRIRKSAPAVLKASDLFDEKKDLDAQVLMGNTYSRVGLADQARDTYKEARKIAEVSGAKGKAQMVDALSAFTFAREGNPKRAIKVLERLAADPVDRETEAMIWLTIGNSQSLNRDSIAAKAAYERALSLAAPGTAMHAEVTDAIANLH